MMSWLSPTRSAPPTAGNVAATSPTPLTGDLPTPGEEAALLAEQSPLYGLDEAGVAYRRVVRSLMARRARHTAGLDARPDAPVPPTATLARTTSATAAMPSVGSFPLPPPAQNHVKHAWAGLPDLARLASTSPPLPEHRTMPSTGVLPSDLLLFSTLASDALASPTARTPVAPITPPASVVVQPSYTPTSRPLPAEGASPPAPAVAPAWSWDQVLAHRHRLATHHYQLALQQAQQIPVPPQIAQLLGGQAAWSQAPVLAIPPHCYGEEPLRQLRPEDVTAPIMRGVEGGRQFVTLRFVERNGNRQGLLVLHQIDNEPSESQDWTLFNPQRFGPSVHDTHNLEPRLLGLRRSQPERLPPAPDARTMLRAIRTLVVERRFMGRGNYVLLGEGDSPLTPSPASLARTLAMAWSTEVSPATTPRATTLAEAHPEVPFGAAAAGPSVAVEPASATSDDASATSDDANATSDNANAASGDANATSDNANAASGDANATSAAQASTVALDAFAWSSPVRALSIDPATDVPSDLSVSGDSDALHVSRGATPNSPRPYPQPDVDSGDDSSLDGRSGPTPVARQNEAAAARQGSTTTGAGPASARGSGLQARPRGRVPARLQALRGAQAGQLPGTRTGAVAPEPGASRPTPPQGPAVQPLPLYRPRNGQPTDGLPPPRRAGAAGAGHSGQTSTTSQRETAASTTAASRRAIRGDASTTSGGRQRRSNFR